MCKFSNIYHILFQFISQINQTLDILFSLDITNEIHIKLFLCIHSFDIEHQIKTNQWCQSGTCKLILFSSPIISGTYSLQIYFRFALVVILNDEDLLSISRFFSLNEYDHLLIPTA